MDIHEAMKARHSVRKYSDEPLRNEDLDWLIEAIGRANYEGNLSIQLRVDEPSAFVGGFANYGNVQGAHNYIALVGPKGKTLDERLGYYGERLVLGAKMRGMDTCWLGLSYNKSKMGAHVAEDEACPVIIALGYGLESGKAHKVKDLEKLCLVAGKPADSLADLPKWFISGLEAAQLAPTAVNQQRFVFDLVDPCGSAVRAKAKFGPYTRIDLGIARYHFEVGANAVSAEWTWA